MHYTPKLIPGSVLVILMLVAAQSVAAHSRLQTQATPHGISFICLEPYRPALVFPALGAYLPTVAHHVPEIYASVWPRSAETVSVELQVPEGLLQALLREDMTGGSGALQGPEVLLATWSAEGGVQIRQRRPEQCIGSWLSY